MLLENKVIDNQSFKKIVASAFTLSHFLINKILEITMNRFFQNRSINIMNQYYKSKPMGSQCNHKQAKMAQHSKIFNRAIYLIL